MSKFSNEEIQAKADELSAKFGNTVTPIVFNVSDDDQVIGYCQEPEYDVLMYATDCYLSREVSKAVEACLKNCLIVEESDSRILSTERKHARIRASFTNAVTKLIIPFADEYKKK